MTYRELEALVAEENRQLRSDDPKFKTVMVCHKEGILLQDEAFYEIRGEYLVVFGEHIKPIVFDLWTVHRYAEFDWEHPLEALDEQRDLVVPDLQVQSDLSDSAPGVQDSLSGQ